MERRESYIDNIDLRIMPFIDFPEYPDRYPALSVEGFDLEFYDELRYTSKRLFEIFDKVAKLLRYNDKDILLDLGILKKSIPYMNIPNKLNLSTWLSRFDYVLDKDRNLKLVELNADTPCAFVEAYYGNGIACDYFGLENPNRFEYSKLVEFLGEVADRVIRKSVDLDRKEFINREPFLFTCFDDYKEDLGTTKFLMEAMKKSKQVNEYNLSIIFESLYKLWVDDLGIILSDGTRPQAVYRMHPLEMLIEERATDGSDLGILFLDKYKEGRFAMMNPPESIIMQDKLFLSLVWNLAESDNKVLTYSDKELIKSVMIPAYVDFDDINNKDKSYWIKKPVYGREGLGIEIIDNRGNVIEESGVHKDVPVKDVNNYLYQEFIDQPVYKEDTDSGIKEGYLTLSCFMLGNNPSAVYGRFSEDRICSTDAYWLPLGIKSI